MRAGNRTQVLKGSVVNGRLRISNQTATAETAESKAEAGSGGPGEGVGGATEGAQAQVQARRMLRHEGYKGAGQVGAEWGEGYELQQVFVPLPPQREQYRSEGALHRAGGQQQRQRLRRA